MNENVILNSVFQVKRGTKARWKEVNPILSIGEPGYEYDTFRLKVGDGKTPWNELPYVGEDSVFNAETHYGFPSIGRANVIYKAESEKKIYQWNSSTLVYEVVSEEENVLEIGLIHGGNANG